LALPGERGSDLRHGSHAGRESKEEAVGENSEEENKDEGEEGREKTDFCMEEGLMSRL
jgi:hypothetical protein